MNECNEGMASLLDIIELSHYEYLAENDFPEKLQKRRSLEALIRKYLTAVYPQKKFIFPRTKQVLRDTFQRSRNFCCDDTVRALNEIAMYGHILLTCPRRKEYRKIKLYSEFYMYIIQRGLAGGDLILQLMGYRKINDMLVFEDPMNSDRVARVSRDALFASVECQIIHSIYSKVITTCREITWFDVFRYREAFAGSEQETVTALIHFHSSNAASFYQPAMYSRSQQNPSPQQVSLPIAIQPFRQTYGNQCSQQYSNFYSTRRLQHPASQPLVQNYYHPARSGDHSRYSSEPEVAGWAQLNHIHHERRPVCAYTYEFENNWDRDLQVYSLLQSYWNNPQYISGEGAAHIQDCGEGTCVNREQVQNPEVIILVPITPLRQSCGYQYFQYFYETRILQHPAAHIAFPTGQVIACNSLTHHCLPHQHSGHHALSSSDPAVPIGGRQINYFHHGRRPL